MDPPPVKRAYTIPQDPEAPVLRSRWKYKLRQALSNLSQSRGSTKLPPELSRAIKAHFSPDQVQQLVDDFLNRLVAHAPGFYLRYCVWNSWQVSNGVKEVDFDDRTIVDFLNDLVIELEAALSSTNFHICVITAIPENFEDVVLLRSSYGWKTQDVSKRLLALLQTIVSGTWNLDTSDSWQELNGKPRLLPRKQWQAQLPSRISQTNESWTTASLTLHWSEPFLTYESDYDVYLKQHSTKRNLANYICITQQNYPGERTMALFISDAAYMDNFKEIFESATSSRRRGRGEALAQRYFVREVCEDALFRIEAILQQSYGQVETLESLVRSKPSIAKSAYLIYLQECLVSLAAMCRSNASSMRDTALRSCDYNIASVDSRLSPTDAPIDPQTDLPVVSPASEYPPAPSTVGRLEEAASMVGSISSRGSRQTVRSRARSSFSATDSLASDAYDRDLRSAYVDDMLYLAQSSDELVLGIKELNSTLLQLLDLNEKRRGKVIGFVVAIFVPLAFATSLFGMNIADSSESTYWTNTTEGADSSAVLTTTDQAGTVSWQWLEFGLVAGILTFISIIIPVIGEDVTRWCATIFRKVSKFTIFACLVGAAYVPLAVLTDGRIACLVYGSIGLFSTGSDQLVIIGMIIKHRGASEWQRYMPLAPSILNTFAVSMLSASLAIASLKDPDDYNWTVAKKSLVGAGWIILLLINGFLTITPPSAMIKSMASWAQRREKRKSEKTFDENYDSWLADT